MTYIIENANLLKQNQLVKTSLLVNDGKILSVQPSFSKYRYMKMDTDNFLMTSTHVFYSDGLKDGSDGYSKNYFIHEYLNKGCTTVIVATEPIYYVNDISQAVNKIKGVFDNSPLDYTVVVKVPIDTFSVPLVQKCKREKIPAILVEFNDPRQLYKIPWGWIREAMFPYNCPLIPVIQAEGPIKEKLLNLWKKILQHEKIPHIDSPLQEKKPLSLEVLKKIGIYPMKGYLQAGGELSYNLYLSHGYRNTSVELETLDVLQLAVTVHKGEVIKVGNKIYYNQNKGEQLVVNRPSFFK